MLDGSQVAATIAVRDIDKAQSFYRDSLGLSVAREVAPGVVIYTASAGSFLQLYERPNHEPSAATVVTFGVRDIDAVVKGLVAKGVAFEEYDMKDLGKTGPDHIATFPDGTRLAWLTDPDGNIIALAEGEM